MPIEQHYGGWRARCRREGQRVRGPVRRTLEEAEHDLTQLQNACRDTFADLRARADAMTTEADLNKARLTLVEAIAEWLRQGNCESLSRGTSGARALATRVRRLDGIPCFSGLLASAKALVREHLALEALAQQADARWLCDLGLQFRLDYGSRPLHTSGLDGSRAYVGLKNLGNSCYVNSVLQCFYGCGPLREDIAGQPSPKGPLAALVQQLFRRLSGRDGQWDYVAPAAVLHQVFLTNEAAFQPGDSADILDCCHLFLHSCLSHSGLYLELPQRAGMSS